MIPSVCFILVGAVFASDFRSSETVDPITSYQQDLAGMERELASPGDFARYVDQSPIRRGLGENPGEVKGAWGSGRTESLAAAPQKRRRLLDAPLVSSDLSAFAVGGATVPDPGLGLELVAAIGIGMSAGLTGWLLMSSSFRTRPPRFASPRERPPDAAPQRISSPTSFPSAEAVTSLESFELFRSPSWMAISLEEQGLVNRWAAERPVNEYLSLDDWLDLRAATIRDVDIETLKVKLRRT